MEEESGQTGRIDGDLRARLMHAYELPKPGDLFAGRYRIEERIGSGGMSDVYRARDEWRGRGVALKVLHAAPEIEGSENLEQRLGVLLQLDHPVLVRTHDVGEHDGFGYLVTELLDGETLRQRVRREGAPPPTEAVDVLARVLEGLEYLHGRGIVHRDVKPQNVMLTPAGPKLLDYGLARRLGIPEDLAAGRAGTREYMAPEQLRGGAVDHRADLFACGAMLYETLTGTVPFDDAQATADTRAAPAFPASVRASLPAALRRATLVAMSVDPADRFATAGEMRKALAAVGGAGLSGRTAMPAPVRRRWLARLGRRLERLGPWLLAALVLPAAGLSWWSTARDRVTGVDWSEGRLRAHNVLGGELRSWPLDEPPLATALSERHAVAATRSGLRAFALAEPVRPDSGRSPGADWSFPPREPESDPHRLRPRSVQPLTDGAAGGSFLLTGWSDAAGVTRQWVTLTVDGRRLGRWQPPGEGLVLDLARAERQRPDRAYSLWLAGRSDTLGGRPVIVRLSLPELKPLDWTLPEATGRIVALERHGHDLRVELSSGAARTIAGFLDHAAGENASALPPEWLARVHTAGTAQELEQLADEPGAPTTLVPVLRQAAKQRRASAGRPAS